MEPSTPYPDKQWYAEVKRLLERWDREKSSELRKVSGLVVTNFSWHYHRDKDAPEVEYAGFRFEGSDHPIKQETWSILEGALSEYGEVPDEEERERAIRARYPQLS